MSESRQRFTGSVLRDLILVLCFGLFIWLLLATLPLFTRDLQIYSVEPWMLSPTDITWRRLLANSVAKPGLRTLYSIASMAFVTVLLFVFRWNRRGMLKESLVGLRQSFSVEWVIEGSRTHLVEYGHFLQVI